MVSLPFPNRASAGRTLADHLREYAGKNDTLILALVRGGVAIGRAMADELHLPLFPYVVRKLGHPGHPEFGVGAIAEGGSTHLDDAVMQAYGIAWEDLESVIEEETKELERRKEAYLVQARPDLKGKTVILTDDGAATGVTMFAAIEDMRRAKVKEVVVALPVCPPDTAAALKEKADHLITLATPALFNAVGQWYLEFPQLEDEEVLRLLRDTKTAVQ